MKPSDNKRSESLGATLFVLAFGLGTLGFLVAVDHPEWFHIRPISTAAGALYMASHPDNASDNQAGAQRP